MGKTTAIEWCDSTLNLEMGCDGCELWNEANGVRHCYAGTLVERYKGRAGWPESFSQPKVFPERLDVAERWPDLAGTDREDKPWLNGYPRMIFLNDMGDTFTESLPFYWLESFLLRMEKMPVIWMLLTKRPKLMRKFAEGFGFPKNFWLMTSVTSEKNTARIEQLQMTRGGHVKLVSYEPALGPVKICGGLSGVIIGGESGPKARPCDLAWIRSVGAQCKAAGVPAFVKQLGSWPFDPDRDLTSERLPTEKWPNGMPHANNSLKLKSSKGGDPAEWPEDLRIRELPRIRQEAPDG